MSRIFEKHGRIMVGIENMSKIRLLCGWDMDKFKLNTGRIGVSYVWNVER